MSTNPPPADDEAEPMIRAVSASHTILGIAPRLSDNAAVILVQPWNDDAGGQNATAVAVDPMMLPSDVVEGWREFWEWANRINFRPIRHHWGGRFDYARVTWTEPPFQTPAVPYDKRAFGPYPLRVDGHKGACPMDRAPGVLSHKK